jgi:hypothetical protein
MIIEPTLLRDRVAALLVGSFATLLHHTPSVLYDHYALALHDRA